MVDYQDVKLIHELEDVLEWEPLTCAEMVEQGLTSAWFDINIGESEEWLRHVRETMWNAESQD